MVRPPELPGRARKKPPAPGTALIDTGATRSYVDSKVIAQLGVKPIGVIITGTAGGPVQQSLFPARFRFPGELLDIEFSSVVGVDLAGQNVAGKNMCGPLWSCCT